MPDSAVPPPMAPPGPTLKDRLGEGFHLLALLGDGAWSGAPEDLARRVDAFLARYERDSAQGPPEQAAQEAKYAFCALMDERVLSSASPLRDGWARAPLQLRHFGEHLAGEGFFRRLAQLRQDPTRPVQALDVFHTCLLLGFQGKYRIEGEERLRALTHQLGREIAQAAGGEAPFAPHWQPPAAARPRREWPLRSFFALLALAGTAGFLTFTCLLRWGA